MRVLLGLLLLMNSSTALQADTVAVAVAANFSAPMKALGQRFEAQSGHQLRLVFGSSGKMFAQIVHGAPYQVFLSADAQKPQKLIDQNLAIAESRFTYAEGALALWCADERFGPIDADTLGSASFRHLAMANARLAPYGLAAREVLQKLALWPAIKARVVTGENIAQTFQFVATGNAELGFVALSQVLEKDRIKSGSAWRVPTDWHSPIRQDAVLLKRGVGSEAAQQFLDYLQSPEAQALIRGFGYQF